MAKGKSTVIADESRGRGVLDDRGKTRVWRSREAMNFDPNPMPLRSQRDVLDYLTKYDVELPNEIMMEWCPLKTDVMVAPLHGGVFVYP